MSRRHGKHEEHVNTEAWSIPYADLLTLLLAFFVVMYAISSLNEGKYRVMSESISAAFKGEPMRETPITISTTSGVPTTNPINLQNPESGGAAGPPTQSKIQAKAPSLQEIADSVAKAMSEMVIKDEVIIRKHEDWVEVEIKNDVLFPSGSATLTPKANGVVLRLGQVLAGISNPIYVEGHTDNVPIQQEIFPSNWELSAARSSAVIRLLAAGGISPRQMTALGFGEYRPTQPNDTPEGRAANRRVLLAILNRDRSGQSLYSTPQATGQQSNTPASPSVSSTSSGASDSSQTAAPGRLNLSPVSGNPASTR